MVENVRKEIKEVLKWGILTVMFINSNEEHRNAALNWSYATNGRIKTDRKAQMVAREKPKKDRKRMRIKKWGRIVGNK